MSGGILLDGSSKFERMQNRNDQILKVDHQEDGALYVREVFTTIQGEGLHAGWPAVFVRLSGCHLSCYFCDTLYRLEEGDRRLTVEELVPLIVQGCHPDNPWPLVVITGGEPLRQNVGPLVGRLLALHPSLLVNIETSGTLPPGPDLEDWLWQPRCSITVSPKTPHVDPEIGKRAKAWKYILRAGELSEEDGLPAKGTQGVETGPPARPMNDAPIYVQPMAEPGGTLDPETGRERSHLIDNIRAAAESAVRCSYRLSLQTHKIVGLP